MNIRYPIYEGVYRILTFIRTIFLFDAFSRSSGDIASVSRRDTGHVPVGGHNSGPRWREPLSLIHI